MKINHSTRTIEMTKKESKAASTYGSDTYKELVAIKRDFPNFNIVVREYARKNSNKGFSYDKMEMYISVYGTEEHMKQFKSMRCMAKDSVSKGKSYIGIKEWFNETFPEASDFSAAMTRITTQHSA